MTAFAELDAQNRSLIIVRNGGRRSARERNGTHSETARRAKA